MVVLLGTIGDREVKGTKRIQAEKSTLYRTYNLSSFLKNWKGKKMKKNIYWKKHKRYWPIGMYGHYLNFDSNKENLKKNRQLETTELTGY